MNVYILAGLLLILAADYVQIAEEWTARGLTDTSYKVVACLIVGPLLMAYGAYLQEVTWLAALFAGVSLCGSVMLALKLRDLIHTRMRTLG